MQIISKQGQWLGDIAVREAGSIEDVVAMSVQNGLSVTDPLAIGTELLQPESIDKRVMNYYKRNNINVATASELKDERLFGGIGNMGIEINFVVY